MEVLEINSVPGLMVNMPPRVATVPHVPPVWVMRSIPAGCVSLNWTFVSEVRLGLVTVTVMIERPPTSTVDGLNELVIVAATCAKASPVKDAVMRAAAIVASTAARRGTQSTNGWPISSFPATAAIACRSRKPRRSRSRPCRARMRPPEPIARMALRYL